MRRFLAAVAAFFVMGGAVCAEDTPPVTDWVMEVVVVNGNAVGPALWRLKKGDSEVWVLGTVGLMPEKLEWNSSRLGELIEGANAVLLPPQASAGLLDFLGMSWFLITHRDALSMPDDQKLEDSFSPPVRARFVKAREELKKDADRYEDDSPLLAGFKLINDFVQTNKLEMEGPERVAEKLARAKKVKVRRIAEYSAVPLVKEMLKLPPEAGRVCFESALNDYEVLSRHAVPASEAWAVGDVAGIKAHYSTSLFQSCIGQAKKFNELNEQAVQDTVEAVRDALSKSGKTVMLINIGWLFRAGGAAEKLKAEGVTIEGPAE